MGKRAAPAAPKAAAKRAKADAVPVKTIAVTKDIVLPVLEKTIDVKKKKDVPVLSQSALKTLDVKKKKCDPALSSITDVIMDSEHLPHRVRTLLVDMIPFTLEVPLGDRHAMTRDVLDMMKQTLNSKKSALEASLLREEDDFLSLQSSKLELTNAVSAAEAGLSMQNSTVDDARRLLDEATAARKCSWTKLEQKRGEQKTSADRLARAQSDKGALESAFEAHFKPIAAGAGAGGLQHFRSLEPFFKDIDIDASLLIALPSCCEKSKEQMCAFDTVVLEEFEKALLSQIEALGEAVAKETPAAAACDAAAAIEQEEYDVIETVAKRAATEAEVAQQKQHALEAAATTAKQKVQELPPKMNLVGGLIDKARMDLEAFRAGPMAAFISYTSMGTSIQAVAAGA